MTLYIGEHIVVEANCKSFALGFLIWKKECVELGLGFVKVFITRLRTHVER